MRTKDWVARWNAPGNPGVFKLAVNGTALESTFGTEGAEWGWQDGGTVTLSDKKVTLSLQDLKGFNGRCDAIYFTQGDDVPPNESTPLTAWRKRVLRLPDAVQETDRYDLVVVGGGYSGMGSDRKSTRLNSSHAR